MSSSISKDLAIIGGGISGLAALHFARTLRPALAAALYEKEARLGGTVGTDRVAGYSFDWGPNGFLDREPLTLRLAGELGLEDRLERASAAVQKRFILRGGRLREVPMSPPAFLRSDILSLRGRLRVAMEPFGRKRPEGIDESVYDFARRRIGREAADYLVQPMVSGVYGGMADRLSLRATFRLMAEMEAEYGSLLRAMVAKMRATKRSGRAAGGPAGPGGWLTSFRGGLDAVIARARERYGDDIATGAGAVCIERDGRGYRVGLADGREVRAPRVILATPSYEAAALVRPLSAKLSEARRAIEYAPIAVVCSGYDGAAVGRAVDGFGFLVPRVEGRRILGSIWTSSIFADRAPAGKVQFRTMVGGDGDREVMNLTDEELQETVHRDLSAVMALRGGPEVIRIYRWERGIPQFTIGHLARLALIEAELARLGNIAVTGNAYYGIGLNDCVKQSFRAVGELPERL